MISKKNTFRYIPVICGLLFFLSCQDQAKDDNSIYPDRGLITGTYKSNDESNTIVITVNLITYARTFTGYEGNFTFEIDEESDWVISNHPKKYDCYVVMVRGVMSGCSGSRPNSNIIDGADTLTFIVRMEYVNGRQTGNVLEILFSEDDLNTELAYRKK